MKRKLLSIVLCLAMAFTMMPYLGGVSYAATATAVTITASDGTETVLSADATGTNYSYEAETSTLTLNNWSGRKIAANGDLNLNLVGDNTITIVNGDGERIGLYAGTSGSLGDINIYASEPASLTIQGDGITNNVEGIDGRTNLMGNVTLSIQLTNCTGGSISGTYGPVNFKGSNNTLDIDVSGRAGWEMNGVYNGSLCADYRDCAEEMTGNSADIRVENSSAMTVRATDINISRTALDLNLYANNTSDDPTTRIACSFAYIKGYKAGTIRVTKGVFKQSTGNLAYFDKSFNATLPEGDNYWWKPIGSYSYMADQSGNLLEDITITAYTGEAAGPTWTAGNLLALPSMHQDEYFSQTFYLLAGVRGLSDNDDVRFELKAGSSLPAGLSVYNSGIIGGTPTEECPAGTATIVCTDRVTNKSIEFELSYGAITEPDRQMTVDGTSFEMKTSQSGTGWSYDATNRVLTLNNYSGGPIIAEKDYELKLIGTNVIMIPSGSGELYGLKTSLPSQSKTATISAASPATLIIQGDGLDVGGYNIYGIYGDVSLTGNVSLNVDLTNVTASTVYGSFNTIEFAGSNNDVSINITGNPSYEAHGLGGLSIDHRDCEDMTGNNVYVTVDSSSDTRCYGMHDLYINGSGVDLRLYVNNASSDPTSRRAINYMNVLNYTSGTIQVTKGVVRQYYGNFEYNFDDSLVSTKPANDNYYWKTIGDYCYVADVDGNILENIIFQANPEDATAPRWTAGNLISIPACETGTYITNMNLLCGIRGLRNNDKCKFEVVDGQLPEGVYLYQSGLISGTANTPCPAGTATIRCTDTVNDQYVDFELPYGQVTSSNPVIDMTLSSLSATTNPGTRGTFTVSVVPADATYKKVTARSSNPNVAYVSSISEPDVNGVSTIEYTAATTGTTTITVESLDTHITKTFILNVKESAVNAVIDYDREQLRNLLYTETYKINDGITTTEVTTDENGRIDINEAWMGKTISIVKKGDTPELDSEPQELAIPARPAAPTGITTENATSFTASDGRILGGNSSMSYCLKGTDDTYYASEAIYSLGTGTYEIWVRATYASFRGEKTEVFVDYDRVAFDDNYDFNIPAGAKGTTYTANRALTGKGGTAPYTFELVSGPSGLTLGSDNRLTFVRSEMQAATTATLRITDAAGETNTLVITVGAINGVDISGMTPSGYEEFYYYTGEEIRPAIVVEGLRFGYDYTLDYANNVEAGTATVTIRGVGGYAGSITVNFEIRVCTHNYVHHDAQDATCTDIGWYAYDVCTICGQSNYVEIPATGHDQVSHDAKAPTCTEDGWYSYYTCTKCDYTTKVVRPALTHNLVHHDAKEATCLEGGWNAYDTCDRCDYTTKVDVPALGHNLTHHDAKPVTCLEDGWDAYDTCDRCDLNTQVIKRALGHKFENYVLNNDATCLTDETKTAKCENEGCTATDTVSILGTKLGHDVKHFEAKEPTCTEVGYDAYDGCTRCDYAETPYVEKPALGHVDGEWVVDVKATTAPGSKHLECAVCKATLDTQVIPAIVLKAPAKVTAVLTTKFSKTGGYNDIKVTWPKVENATGYTVYYKKGTGSYVKMVDTKATTVYKKDLAAGAKYTIKVVPYVTVDGVKYRGSAVKTTTVYTLKKLNAPVVTKSGTKVKVKWNNIEGETGYQISQSTTKKGTKIVTTYATAKGTYKLLTATKGKTYYYKVRAYKTVGGVKIYGPWSTVKAFKR